MDYRQRKYYAIRLSNFNDDIKLLKMVVPSLKISKLPDKYENIVQIFNQVMVSCKIEESNKLEEFFIMRFDDRYSRYYLLTKEILGQ